MSFIMKVLLCVLLMVPVQSWAYPNEKAGFRDMYWGQSLEDIQKIRNIEFVGTNDISHFDGYWADFRENESKELSGVPFYREKFGLSFYQGHLIAIEMAFENTDANFERLKRAMEWLYGEAVYYDGMYEWIGYQTGMTLQRLDESGIILLAVFDRQQIENVIDNVAAAGW